MTTAMGASRNRQATGRANKAGAGAPRGAIDVELPPGAMR